jgi:glucose/arabinose dehydrogenase
MSILGKTDDEPLGVIERFRGLAILAGILVVLWLIAPYARYIPETRADPAISTTEEGAIRVVTITERLFHPWGIAFLPNGDILVTELAGHLR